MGVLDGMGERAKKAVEEFLEEQKKKAEEQKEESES